MSHTLEPWRVEICEGCGALKIHGGSKVDDDDFGDDSPEDDEILTAHFISGCFSGRVRREEDARRIVACVNALKGIPIEVLERGELLEYMINKDER